jgi:hypothetical protein
MLCLKVGFDVCLAVQTVFSEVVLLKVMKYLPSSWVSGKHKTKKQPLRVSMFE